MVTLILDGGLGHYLKDKGIHEIKNLRFDQLSIAGALANLERPELVLQAHNDFIEAGADVITTNTFSCTAHSMSSIGQSHGYGLDLAAAAGKLAREAADKSDRQILVAGCLPPLQESYQTKDLWTLEQLQPEYFQLATALSPFVDLFLCETLSSSVEGIAAASAIHGIGKPWWISFTLDDSITDGICLRSGEVLADVLQTILDLPGLDAVLVNCCSPKAVTAAVPLLRKTVTEDIPIGGYANGFRTTTSEWLMQKNLGESSTPTEPQPKEEFEENGIILPDVYATYAKQWEGMGASIIGGCCGTRPDHIAALRRVLS